MNAPLSFPKSPGLHTAGQGGRPSPLAGSLHVPNCLDPPVHFPSIILWSPGLVETQANVWGAGGKDNGRLGYQTAFIPSLLERCCWSCHTPADGGWNFVIATSTGVHVFSRSRHPQQDSGGVVCVCVCVCAFWPGDSVLYLHSFKVGGFCTRLK